METKDWITLFALCTTIFSSYILLSKQIGKNKRSKWIDDFTHEVANFLSLSMTLSDHPSKEELLNLSKSGCILLLFLNSNIQIQNKLKQEINNTIQTLLVGQNTKDKIVDHSKDIMDLSNEIIREETKKL